MVVTGLILAFIGLARENMALYLLGLMLILWGIAQ
jgi:hypothetical protein